MHMYFITWMFSQTRLQVIGKCMLSEKERCDNQLEQDAKTVVLHITVEYV